MSSPQANRRALALISVLGTAAIIGVTAANGVPVSPQYSGEIRCNLPGCTPGITHWSISGGTNRGYTLANAMSGQTLPFVLIDDTDPNRAEDFAAACTSGLYKAVLITIGQGEPAAERFDCPSSGTLGIGLREFYPFWTGRQALPWASFRCDGLGWVAQGSGWAWGGYAADNGTGPPATLAQTATEILTLQKRCPVLKRIDHFPDGTYVSGTEAIF